jgi:hypothetical protein
VDRGDEALWAEWLALYLEHCRRRLRPSQLLELAEALPTAVAGGERLDRLVGEATAAEGHWLAGFLVGVEHQPLRSALLAEACARLRSASHSG